MFGKLLKRSYSKKLNICIVGSGPSGFYTRYENQISHDFQANIY
jgi:hypothetical protein